MRHEETTHISSHFRTWVIFLSRKCTEICLDWWTWYKNVGQTLEIILYKTSFLNRSMKNNLWNSLCKCFFYVTFGKLFIIYRIFHLVIILLYIINIIFCFYKCVHFWCFSQNLRQLWVLVGMLTIPMLFKNSLLTPKCELYIMYFCKVNFCLGFVIYIGG